MPVFVESDDVSIAFWSISTLEELFLIIKIDVFWIMRNINLHVKFSNDEGLSSFEIYYKICCAKTRQVYGSYILTSWLLLHQSQRHENNVIDDALVSRSLTLTKINSLFLFLTLNNTGWKVIFAMWAETLYSNASLMDF